ncbi:MAG: 4'-phosphopantetheinyl transferase superfamily protein [Polyangiaceae bacterium]
MITPSPLSAVPAIPESARLPPPPGVDLWCFFYEPHDAPELLAAYDALLTDDERVRHQRFYFEKDRLLFLATRALVRTTLSAYADLSPDAWRFDQGEHGKPFLIGEGARFGLAFNLSNTRGLVACAVSTTYERLGVDVENVERAGDTVGIADRFFSPHEVDALHALPVAEQQRRFFSYWTLKESYIKARGMGLAIPLDQFSFLLDEGPEIGIAFDPRLEDDPSRWRFFLHQASPRHQLAVGVDSGGARPELRLACVVPLRGRDREPPW